MHITMEKDGATLLMKLQGRLDVANASVLEQAAEQALQAGDQLLVLDFSKLDYISSAGLRSLLTLHKQVKAQDGKLALCNLQGMVKEVLDISGLATMLAVFDSTAAALAAMR
ncbi:MAG: STAS domain-containing protein [Lentisphaerae bacterium]|nr:STAS domain-containing protein [Lentisphaerota bacterium]